MLQKKAARDLAVGKAAGLKSWDSKKVRHFLTCCHCGKRRLIYSQYEADFGAAKTVMMTQKLESVSERYSCGDLLFDD